MIFQRMGLLHLRPSPPWEEACSPGERGRCLALSNKGGFLLPAGSIRNFKLCPANMNHGRVDKQDVTDRGATKQPGLSALARYRRQELVRRAPSIPKLTTNSRCMLQRVILEAEEKEPSSLKSETKSAGYKEEPNQKSTDT